MCNTKPKTTVKHIIQSADCLEKSKSTKDIFVYRWLYQMYVQFSFIYQQHLKSLCFFSNAHSCFVIYDKVYCVILGQLIMVRLLLFICVLTVFWQLATATGWYVLDNGGFWCRRRAPPWWSMTDTVVWVTTSANNMQTLTHTPNTNGEDLNSLGEILHIHTNAHQCLCCCMLNGPYSVC